MLKYRIIYEAGTLNDHGESTVFDGELDLKTYVKIGKYISEDLCDMAYGLADKGYYRVFLWRPTNARWEYVANSYTDFDKPRRKWL